MQESADAAKKFISFPFQRCTEPYDCDLMLLIKFQLKSAMLDFPGILVDFRAYRFVFQS